LIKFTRRKFLEVGISGAAAFALESRFGPLLHALEPFDKNVSRTTGRLRRSIPTICRQCSAGCGILGFVEDGKLVGIQGNPLHPNNRGKICAKGLAGINHLYDPDRVLYPMRRTGARGEGQWERIGWDEALSEVAGKLRTAKKKGSYRGVIFEKGALGERDLTTRFLKAFGDPLIIDHSVSDSSNRTIAHELTWGKGRGISDVAHSRYILNFGANPYESHSSYINLAQRIVEGRAESRAKLVTFDPRLSNTAGRSDEWFPLRPGTDGIVALSMANVIMKRGLYDGDFLGRWTNYPTGRLARWLSQYTPESAQRESGVSPSNIERIAVEFATMKPATTISGSGVTSHYNGTYNERCILLLNAVTGNIDIKGGYCLPRSYQQEDKPSESGKQASLTSLLREEGGKADIYISYLANPAYMDPENTYIKEQLTNEKVIPYFVVIDTHMSETGALADLFLPCATYLESWALGSESSYELIPYLGIQQPVVKPLGESLEIGDICIRLAKRIGGKMDLSFNFSTVEEYIKTAVPEGLKLAGGLEYLKTKGVWFDPGSRPVYQSYKKRGFNTPSRKFEIYSGTMMSKGNSPLPIYRPVPSHRDLKRQELILVKYKLNVNTLGAPNAKWLSEIFHTNPLWINPETARARGIKDGDLIKITSSKGSITSRAQLREGINPGVVAIASGVGHEGYGNVARAKKVKSKDPDTSLLWWGRKGNGVNPNSIISLTMDPVGGGQAWMDTIITVTKA
jgi:anaerobic selenocysteine-containing dehydrogenase